MRSVLRLEVIGDPFDWSEEAVIFAFAARTKPPSCTYEEWCLRLGLAEKMQKEKEQDENSVALSQLRAVNPDIVITPADRPE